MEVRIHERTGVIHTRERKNTACAYIHKDQNPTGIKGMLHGAARMAKWMRVLAANTDDLSSIPRT